MSAMRSTVSERVERITSGRASRQVREYWAEKRKAPTVVRLIDKFGFLFGVLSLASSEYVLCRLPALFWGWYALFMGVMLATRIPDYRHKRFGYFLFDFCYFANATQFIQLVGFPSNCALFKVNFAFAMGPLCAAVILWRNSLVFHDHEKVITVWIHVLPSWLVYATRWQDGSGTFKGRMAALGNCEAFGVADYVRSLAGYALWQALYFIKTEVLDRDALDADPSCQTSLRWLASDTERPIHGLVLGLVRKCGLMGATELFDSAKNKTKLIFMASQLIYTAITLVPVPLLYRSYWLLTVTVPAIFSVAVYNGGEYYIEVFSRRYYRQFGEAAGETVRDPDAEPPVSNAKGSEVRPSRAAASPPPGDGGNPRTRSGPHDKSAPPPIVSDEDPEEAEDVDEEAIKEVLRALSRGDQLSPEGAADGGRKSERSALAGQRRGKAGVGQVRRRHGRIARAAPEAPVSPGAGNREKEATLEFETHGQ